MTRQELQTEWLKEYCPKCANNDDRGTEYCNCQAEYEVEKDIDGVPSADRPIKLRNDGTLFVKVLDVSKVERVIIGDDNSAIREDFVKPFSNHIMESPNEAIKTDDEVIERPIIEHDRGWIIGCIKHDGFIKTDRFDKANKIILDALADRPTEDRLYIKIYADDEPSVKAEKLYQICGETENRETAKWLKEYFPSADRPMGEWLDLHEDGHSWFVAKCSQCGKTNRINNYCPSCGARMEDTK